MQELTVLRQRVTILEGMLQAQDKDARTRQEEQENLAHQLKSSLNSLSLRLELTGVYDQMETSFVHMNRHLDQLLNKATIHHNDRQLVMEIVSLKEVLEQEVLPELAGFEAQIEQDLSPGWLYADRYLLTQALETLLNNACRHGHKILVTVSEQRGTVECRVENDTKTRIVPSMKRYETEESGHYGIGLDLARTAARLHGGDLMVALEKDQFIACMRLPVHPWESEDAIFQKGFPDSMDPEVEK